MAEAKVNAPPKARYRFFLNPHDEYAYTKCPKCGSKTKIRKFPLVIHIEPNQLLLLNKKCRFCSHCELVIARKSEIETFMVEAVEKRAPDLIGNDYLVVGTMDRKDWHESRSGKIDQATTVERLFVFQDVWKFKVIPGGWYREGEHPLERLERGEGPESVFPPKEKG